MASIQLLTLALAHLMPAQQGTLHQVGDSVFSVLSVPVGALPGVDDDRDGRLSLAELALHRDTITSSIAQGFGVSSEAGVGPLERVDLALGELATTAPPASAQVMALVHHRFSRVPQRLRARFTLFGTRAEEQQVTLTASREGLREALIFTPSATEHELFQSTLGLAADFARSGALHVLSGADHLLFLLLAVGFASGWRRWLGVATTFTVAHSLTLASSVLGWVHTPARVVEPLIAASIVALAVENLVSREEGRHRLAVVFGFGLLHGLGFASALDSLQATGSRRLAALAGFNLGVELGQLLFLLVAAALLALATRALSSTALARAPRLVSLAAGTCGVVWVFTRL